MNPVDALPPTQYLIMEVLAARERAGEQSWPFPARLRPALRALQAAALVQPHEPTGSGMVRVRLTDIGRAAVMSQSYSAPVPTLAQAVQQLPGTNEEILAWLRRHGMSLTPGAGVVLAAVREDLRAMTGHR